MRCVALRCVALRYVLSTFPSSLLYLRPSISSNRQSSQHPRLRYTQHLFQTTTSLSAQKCQSRISTPKKGKKQPQPGCARAYTLNKFPHPGYFNFRRHARLYTIPLKNIKKSFLALYIESKQVLAFEMRAGAERDMGRGL